MLLHRSRAHLENDGDLRIALPLRQPGCDSISRGVRPQPGEHSLVDAPGAEARLAARRTFSKRTLKDRQGGERRCRLENSADRAEKGMKVRTEERHVSTSSYVGSRISAWAPRAYLAAVGQIRVGLGVRVTPRGERQPWRAVHSCIKARSRSTSCNGVNLGKAGFSFPCLAPSRPRRRSALPTDPEFDSIVAGRSRGFRSSSASHHECHYPKSRCSSRIQIAEMRKRGCPHTDAELPVIACESLGLVCLQLGATTTPHVRAATSFV